MSDQHIFNKLPEELIEKIFTQLEVEDVKTGRLVCRRWELHLSRSKKLWRGAILRIDKTNANKVLDNTELVLSIGFMKICKEIPAQAIKELFDKIKKFAPLQLLHQFTIDIEKGVDMSVVEPLSLASIVTNLYCFKSEEDEFNSPDIDFFLNSNSDVEKIPGLNSTFKSSQLNCIFHTLASASDLKIKCLHIHYVDLSECDPRTLAKALCRIHTVDFRRTHLTTPQLETILVKIRDSQNLTLTVLSVPQDGLYRISQSLKQQAESKVKIISVPLF